uniref:Histidine kinase (EC) n=1 Tax=Ganoderma boninense TaxID=34458 RepID=A0A5K1K163_9APHY|nr:Histidine kinase (EC [Ganoderma boninense]
MKDVMIGDEAAENRNFLQATQPMEHRIVRNWEDMKLLWDYTFDEKLWVLSLGEHNRISANGVLTTSLVPRSDNGMVVHSEVLHIVPVYDGFSLPHLVLI